jgi:hypothetical protein
MNSFKRLYENKPDTNLFHYTSAQGLYGIMMSGELWASKVDYLNDHKEIQPGRVGTAHVVFCGILM